jgi:hypothetical protein
MRQATLRTARRLERLVVGAAMVGIAWFLERRLVRAVGRRGTA